MSAVAASDVRRPARFHPPVRQLQPRDDAVNRLIEID
jgi:hypothetical protein